MSRKTKEKRKELSLSDKVNVIKEFKKSGKSQRLLAVWCRQNADYSAKTIKRKAEYNPA